LTSFNFVFADNIFFIQNLNHTRLVFHLVINTGDHTVDMSNNFFTG
jgi:hypothetical protein